MSNAEHIMENALMAISKGRSYEEWIKSEPNKEYVKSDTEEIWEMAMYVYYTWRD